MSSIKKTLPIPILFKAFLVILLAADFFFYSYNAFGFHKKIIAQNDQHKKIEQFQKKAEDIDRKIEKSKARVLKFSGKESTIVYSLDRIDLSLNKAVKRVSANKSELATLDKKITNSTNEYKKLVKEIETTEDYAAKRLVALYKINRLGQLNLLATADSMYDLFQRKATLERVLEYDEEVREALIKDKARLNKVLNRLNDHQIKKISLEADINKQIKSMSQKREKRSKLLTEIRSKKSYELAAIESLKITATALDKKIKSLSSDLSRHDQKINSSFLAFKGLLIMPVRGKIINLFGHYQNTKFNVTNFRSGIDIKAKRGESVLAVCAGKVLYASWFKGYGNMIIIDHGNSYYTLYAHVEETFKAKGDAVETGEVIATVGDTGSMIGPNLHFEIRHHGKPVDPLKWLKTG